MTKYVLFSLLLSGPLLPALAAPPRLSAPDSMAQVLGQPGLSDAERVATHSELCWALASLDLPAAIGHGRQGLALARAQGLAHGEAGACSALGMATFMAGDLNASERYFEQGLAPARRSGRSKDLLSVLTGLGNVAVQLSQYERARRAYLEVQALLLHQPHPDLNSLAAASANLGLVSQRLADDAVAIGHITKALALFGQARNASGQAQCYFNLADCYAATRPARARQALAQAVALHRRLGDTLMLSADYRELGRWHLAHGPAPRARALLRHALALARQVGATSAEGEALKLLADTEARLGDFAAAFAAQKAFQTLRDTLLAQEKTSELAQLQVRFDVARQQERIGTLTQARNRAEAQRRTQRVRLQQLGWLAAGLLGLVGGLTVLYFKLRHSRAQIAALARTKDLLMAVVGHDLRGPVAAFGHLGHSIGYYARTAPHELPALGQEVAATAQRLATLLDNLLHWATAQRNPAAPALLPLELPAVAADPLHLLGPDAAAKNVALRSHFVPGQRVLADAQLLATVLRNLAGNALKFTPPGGRIELGATALASGHLEVWVQDTGVGIAPERLPQLQRLEASPGRSTAGTANETGTGLGLLVCHDFVRRLGSPGGLRVHSAGLGQGSRFSFALQGA